jgi:hypothetical protein
MVMMLDETHTRLTKEKGDENEYTLGRIGVHNVVIACLPAGLLLLLQTICDAASQSNSALWSVDHAHAYQCWCSEDNRGCFVAHCNQSISIFSWMCQIMFGYSWGGASRDYAEQRAFVAYCTRISS